MAKPSKIKLHRVSRVLEVAFDNGEAFQLPCEYLRVFSPSAEVQGHGAAEPVLVPGKRGVNISQIEPVGRYAVRLIFDDAHRTGLYSWEVLLQLGRAQAENWQTYLRRMNEQGMSRDSDLVKLGALPRKYTPG